MKQLYLASGSPRRKELLAQIGVPFTALSPPNIDETPYPNEAARHYVARLAEDKANAGWQSLAVQSNAVVLGADTIVVEQEQLLGKPADKLTAINMLHELSGSTHEVLTGVCLHSEQGSRTEVVTTQVTMKTLTPQQIERYVLTGEPLDKAGAYGIQGLGATLIDYIHGCYGAVVGLPLAVTATMLEEAGIAIWQQQNI